MTNKKALLKYLLALILFGSNGIIASFVALRSYEIVTSRAVIGVVFLAIVFLIGRNKITFFSAGKQGIYLATSGIAMGASWMFLYEAYQQIGVSISTLIYYCGPVIVMILAPIVFNEKITSSKVIGFIAVFIGMILINGFGALSKGASWGLICGLLAAITYSVMIICNKKATKTTGLENSLWQLFFGSIVTIAFTLVVNGGLFSIPGESVLPLLVLGVINTGLGCYLYFSAIGKLPAQTVSTCGYLEPLSAVLMSAVFLGERLIIPQIIGTVLILSGAAFGELRRRSSLISTNSTNDTNDTTGSNDIKP